MIEQLHGFDIRGEVAHLGPILDSEVPQYLSGDRRQQIQSYFVRTSVREVLIRTLGGRSFTIPVPARRSRKILGVRDWAESSIESQVSHFVCDSPFPCYLASSHSGEILVMNGEFRAKYGLGQGPAIAPGLNIRQHWLDPDEVLEELEQISFLEEGKEDSLGTDKKPYMIQSLDLKNPSSSKNDARITPCIIFRTRVFGHFCLIYVELGSQGIK